MPIPRLTEQELRNAVSEGWLKEPGMVELLSGSWLTSAWARLTEDVPEGSSLAEHLKRTRLRGDLSLSREAETEFLGDEITLRVHYGLIGWIYACVRAFVRAQTPTDEDPSAIDRAGTNLCYSISWVTSPARHVRGGVWEEMGAEADARVLTLAEYAVLFVLVHELGHIEMHARGNPQQGPDDELVADAWAFRYLLEQVTRGEQADADFIRAIAIFFWSECLVEAYGEMSPGATHPPARQRLSLMRDLVAQFRPAQSSAFDGVGKTFELLVPIIRDSAPSYLLTTDEIADMITMAGQDPERMRLHRVTLREVYEMETTEFLRSLVRNGGDVADEKVSELLALCHRMPVVVLDVLNRAYKGRLLPAEDADAIEVHRLGQRLHDLIPDNLVRKAIIAE